MCNKLETLNWQYISEKLKKLDLLDVILEDLRSIRKANVDFLSKINSQKIEREEKKQKNTVETVKENENKPLRENEHTSDNIDREDQKITCQSEVALKLSVARRALRNYSTKKPNARNIRLKRNSAENDKKNELIEPTDFHGILLKLAETKFLQRQKKVKCDDGG